ncbi:MAG: hypothetical protein D6820_17245, partial [Lentisphaerae bacterium]
MLNLWLFQSQSFFIMNDIYTIAGKIIFLICLIGSGCLAKKWKLLSEKGEHELSKLLIDFFWPALIFYNIVNVLHRDELLPNLLLPLSAMVTALTGFAIAYPVGRFLGYRDARHAMFVYHVTICNFVFMVLPFVKMMIPGKGPALLFIHNLG